MRSASPSEMQSSFNTTVVYAKAFRIAHRQTRMYDVRTPFVGVSVSSAVGSMDGVGMYDGNTVGGMVGTVFTCCRDAL